MIDARHETLEAAAAIVLAGAAARGIRIATAENCTGGLIATLLSGVDTRAHWFERGLVVASGAAQRDLLGVPQALFDQCGPVSQPVAPAGAIAGSASMFRIPGVWFSTPWRSRIS